MDENTFAGRGAMAAAGARRQQAAGKRAALGDLTNVDAGGVAAKVEPDDAVSCLSKRSEMEQELLNPNRALSAQRDPTDDQVKRLPLGLAAASDGRDVLRKDHPTLSNQKPASSKDTLEKEIRELESTIDELFGIFCHQHDELIRVNDRLRVEVGKVKSLEQEVQQLPLQIASLESEVGPHDYPASSTEVLHAANTFSSCHTEAKQTVVTLRSASENKREAVGVEELKVQAGTVDKQPEVIEISDDENTSLSNDNDSKRSLKSDPSCSGKLDFVKKKHVVIVIDDEEEIDMWTYDDMKCPLKTIPSCSGEPDEEAVLDCCGCGTRGTAPCFTCSRHPQGSRQPERRGC